MKLLTKTLREKLDAQGRHCEYIHNITDDYPDLTPVVKFFTPDGSATWLITLSEPDEPDLLYGLCDLGLGYPETGYVRLSELASARGPLGLPVERDRHFKATKPLSGYLKDALNAGHLAA